VGCLAGGADRRGLSVDQQFRDVQLKKRSNRRAIAGVDPAICRADSDVAASIFHL